MLSERVIFIFAVGFLDFVNSKNDGWLHWTQWSECPDLICSGERYKPLIRRSRECRNTVFGEDTCGDQTIEVEEKNCRPNIPVCTHEWTLWTNVSHFVVDDDRVTCKIYVPGSGPCDRDPVFGPKLHGVRKYRVLKY